MDPGRRAFLRFVATVGGIIASLGATFVFLISIGSGSERIEYPNTAMKAPAAILGFAIAAIFCFVLRHALRQR
jgi:hypothetical protein